MTADLRTIRTAADLGPDPYEHVLFRGKPLDQATAAALIECEVRLGYQLTVVQGVGGAKASGGTHLEGRAVDLAPYDAAGKCAALEAVGFARWHRLPLPGVWGEHVHAVLILEDDDNPKGIAPGALAQIPDWRGGRSGLKGHAPDPDAPHRVVRYHYNPARTRELENRGTVTVNNVTKARDALVEAGVALGKCAIYLERTPRRRSVARAGAVTARSIRRAVNGLLIVLPKV